MVAAVIALVFALAWSDYAVGFWGWCLLRGYDVPFRQVVSPLHPYSGKWPPPKIPKTQVFPGKPQSSGASTSSATGSKGKPGTPASIPTGVVAGGHGR